MKHIDLKIDSIYFRQIKNQEKTFEVRKSDREYSKGDILCLNEYDRILEKYSGAKIYVEVLGVFGKFPHEKEFVKSGYVLLSIYYDEKFQSKHGMCELCNKPLEDVLIGFQSYCFDCYEMLAQKWEDSILDEHVRK